MSPERWLSGRLEPSDARRLTQILICADGFRPGANSRLSYPASLVKSLRYNLSQDNVHGLSEESSGNPFEWNAGDHHAAGWIIKNLAAL